MSQDKPGFRITWIELGVIVGVITLLIAILLPAVQQAREAARRTTTRCRLKQIGLALHNYHDVFSMFPPGGVFNEDGVAFHGWTSAIAPFLDCSPFYNSLNFSIPWDDPQQIEKFITQPHPVFQNPSQETAVSPDGIPLVHFSANQWLIRRNSSTSIKDIETGTSNTLAMANAFGHFAPLGYPYNWRDPLIPINTSPDGFGYNKTGMTVLLMDGSVRWIAKDMAVEIHASFAGPEKLKPTAEEVEKPAGEYRLKIPPWRTHEVFLDRSSLLHLVVRTNSADQPVTAMMKYSYDKGGNGSKGPFDQAINGLLKYPDLPEFYGDDYFSDAGLKTLSQMQKLKVISVGGNHITDVGAGHLAAIRSLTSLTLDQTEVTATGLEELSRLPNLSTLHIIEPAFGDEGIEALANFPALTDLRLEWHFRPANVTDLTVAELKAKHPHLRTIKIRRNGQLLEYGE